MLEKSHEFETFLDDYHARSNRRFVYFAELNASVRNFADVAHVLNHLDVRFSAYDVRFADERRGAPSTRSTRSAPSSPRDPLRERVDREAAGGAARRRRASSGSRCRSSRRSAATFPRSAARVRLPHDLDHEEVDGQGGAVAVLLNGFLQRAEQVQRLRRARCRRRAAARWSSSCATTSPRPRRATSRAAVHNLQSSYDTYVKPTRAHQEVDGLQRFRGHVSLALHLFEVANHLIHFYERHESEEIARHRRRSASRRSSRASRCSHHVVQFAARHAVAMLAAAQPLVQALLPRFAQQRTLELAVPDGGSCTRGRSA